MYPNWQTSDMNLSKQKHLKLQQITDEEVDKMHYLLISTHLTVFLCFNKTDQIEVC